MVGFCICMFTRLDYTRMWWANVHFFVCFFSLITVFSLGTMTPS